MSTRRGGNVGRVGARSAIGLASACGLALALVGVVACDRGGAPPAPPDGSGPDGIGPDGPRVVSLSPAITRTMIDLGAGDLLVGRTPFCRGAGDAVPAVGSLLEFDPEAMLAVDPDLVLVQPGAAGLDPDLEALAEREGWRIRTWPIDGLADLERLLEELPETLAASANRESIERRASERRSDLAAVLAPLPEAASPVVVLFAMEPPMAFGRGTFVGDLLERNGIENAVSARGYPELSAEDLAVLAPSRIVLVRDGPSEAARRRLATLPVPTPPESRRVVEHPDALVPGSAWIDAAVLLREALVLPEGTP